MAAPPPPPHPTPSGGLAALHRLTSMSPPTAIMPGMMRKNAVPAKDSGLPVKRPRPYSPVHSPRKFSLARGATSARRTNVTMPAGSPSMSMRSHTLGSGAPISRAAIAAMSRCGPGRHAVPQCRPRPPHYAADCTSGPFVFASTASRSSGHEASHFCGNCAWQSTRSPATRRRLAWLERGATPAGAAASPREARR